MDKNEIWSRIHELGDAIDGEGYAGRKFWKVSEDRDLKELERILEEDFVFYIPEIAEYINEIKACAEKLHRQNAQR